LQLKWIILIYNINGKFDLNVVADDTLNELKEQNLTVNEAIELLVNRHFTKYTKDDTDIFP